MILLTGSILIIFPLLFTYIAVRFGNHLDLEKCVINQNKKERHLVVTEFYFTSFRHFEINLSIYGGL